MDSDDDLFIERTEEEKIHFIHETVEKLEQLMNATFAWIDNKAGSDSIEFDQISNPLPTMPPIDLHTDSMTKTKPNPKTRFIIPLMMPDWAYPLKEISWSRPKLVMMMRNKHL
jgi:hypothetical protein